MPNFLLGDAFWSPETPHKSAARFIAEEEIPLLHAYNQRLSQGAQLLRAPTRQTSAAYLKAQGLADKIEAVHNIAIQSAQHTKEQGQFDALVAGVLAPPPADFPRHNERALSHELAEPAIYFQYMIDKGADVMVVEGFEDWDLFEVALKALKSVNQVPVPTSAFFRPAAADARTLAKLFVFGETLELEAVGLELTLEQAAGLKRGDLPSDLAFGLQILGGGERIEPERALAQIAELSPTMVLGGEGLPEPVWLELAQGLREL